MPDSNITVKTKNSPHGVECSMRTHHDARMQRLKEIRRNRGLSQVELAEAAGCSQGLISKIEAGRANPTLHQIESIAFALKVSPVLLFGLSGLQQRALDALAALPDDRKAAALVVLESMASRGD